MPETDFILRDKEAEDKFSVTLSTSLTRRRQLADNSEQVFTGKQFFVTDSVLPKKSEMREIIECNGGLFIEDLKQFKKALKRSASTYIVTCADNLDYCLDKLIPLFMKGNGGEEEDYHCKFHTNELILSCVMQQEFSEDKYLIDFSLKPVKKKKTRGRRKR